MKAIQTVPGELGGRSPMPVESVPTFARIPGLRLSRHGTRPSPARMERFLRRLGIPVKRYTMMAGGQGLREFGKANPGWTQRAWEVLILENVETLKPRENGTGGHF